MRRMLAHPDEFNLYTDHKNLMFAFNPWLYVLEMSQVLLTRYYDGQSRCTVSIIIDTTSVEGTMYGPASLINRALRP